MSLLALDLGTKTGWASTGRSGSLRSGTESFSLRKNEGPGSKWIKFRAWLSERAQTHEDELTAIYFEDVRFHGPGQILAAHAYGGFRATLEAWCESNRVQLIPVGVSTIKRHWTGNGAAKKLEMIAMAKQRGYRVVDDNNADALALLDYALKDQGMRRLKLPPAAIFAPKVEFDDPFREAA